MRFIITFIATRASILRKHWASREYLRESSGIVGTNETCRSNVGGAVFLCDSAQTIGDTSIIAHNLVRNPYGIATNGMHAAVVINQPGDESGDRRSECISLRSLPSLEEKGRIECSLFNQCHGLANTETGFLVASTGLDLILEVDILGRPVWEFWLTDNGYETSALGNRRTIDKTIDHSYGDYPTLSQTTHVNCAEPILGGDAVVAVLFHQGELLRIDKSPTTNSVLLAGLRHPHGFHVNSTDSRSAQLCYIVSDTGTNRVLLLAEDFRISTAIDLSKQADWIQDAIYTSRGTVLVADSNHSRLVEVDVMGEFISEWRYDHEYRIFAIKEVAAV